MWHDKNCSQSYKPPSFRKKIFNYFHGLLYDGRWETTTLITDEFVWLNMSAEIKYFWRKNAFIVKKIKSANTQNRQLIFSRNLVVDSFIYILALSDNSPLCILTIVNHFSWWLAAFPIQDISPQRLSYTGQLDHSFNLDFQDVKCIQTTAYRSCVNWIGKRFHWQLKIPLKAKVDSCNWVNNLPITPLPIRNTLKEGMHVFGTSDIIQSLL